MTSCALCKDESDRSSWMRRLASSGTRTSRTNSDGVNGALRLRVRMGALVTLGAAEDVEERAVVMNRDRMIVSKRTWPISPKLKIIHISPGRSKREDRAH